MRRTVVFTTGFGGRLYDRFGGKTMRMAVLQPKNIADQVKRAWRRPSVIQDGRYIELLNGPMLFEHKATPAEYTVGLKLAIEREAGS